MNRIQWLNRSHPQTLYSAVLLSYFSAGFLLLLGSSVERLLALEVFDAIASLAMDGEAARNLGDAIVRPAVVLLLGGAYVAGGAGTASERRWGHWLCSAAAVYSTIANLWWGVDVRLERGIFMQLLFDVLLLVLLFHPMSRNHRRIWFT